MPESTGATGTSGALPLVAGRYRPTALIRASGASQVYRAMDELTGEEVALKLLPERASAPQLRAEVSALRLLHLPGVARLLDEGRHGARPFLAMELVEGTPFPGEPRGAASQCGGAARPRTWSELRGTVVALLEVLARVHDRGVVHRDLKPDNVLVDAYGRPVVLDFGLSSGVAIGSGLDPDHSAVGTPAYAAPEQILGKPLDARADLFALGVMVYEALAGRPPHEGRVADEFLQARLHGSPEPLAALAPHVPRTVCGLVDELLARDPRDRPRSAADVLLRLRGGAASVEDPELPWLAGDRGLHGALRAMLGGRPVDVVGPRGSGKSRFLSELARRAEGRGRRTVELPSGRSPLGSLRPVLGALEELAGADLERALELARDSVTTALAGGAMLFVDGWDELDRWSARVLDEFRLPRPGAATAPGGGALVVARAASRGEARDPAAAHRVRLEPFSEQDLRPLFAGPDRLFHLREDGARELWRRTHGHPSRVAEEVAAWERAGLVRWSGALLAVERKALGRLRMGLAVTPRERSSALGGGELGEQLEEHLAWTYLAGSGATADILARARDQPAWQVEAERQELVDAGALRELEGGCAEALVYPYALLDWSAADRARAHARLGELLELGDEGRLLHLISAGVFEEVPGEARALARRLEAEGRSAGAEAALAEGLAAVRRAANTAVELELLREWCSVALADFTQQAVDRVLYELSRVHLDSDASPVVRAEQAAALDQLERFCRAALATLQGGGEEALTLVEAVPPFEELALERWRLALSVQAARGASAEREAAVFAEIWDTWREHPSELVQAGLAEWMGRLCYRQDEHLVAAEHFARAERLGTRVSSRLSAMLNGAAALLEADQHERAAALAGTARELAAESRHTLFEVRAEWILRAADYRRGRAKTPDLELADAAGRVGLSDQEALICLTEAAVAWRAGDPAAVGLAGRAAALWTAQGKVWGTLLARALELAALGPEAVDAAELAEFAERAAKCPEAYLAGQCLALVERAGAAPHARAREVCAAVRAAFPAERRGARREVLSMAEVLDALGGPSSS